MDPKPPQLDGMKVPTPDSDVATDFSKDGLIVNDSPVGCSDVAVKCKAEENPSGLVAFDHVVASCPQSGSLGASTSYGHTYMAGPVISVPSSVVKQCKVDNDGKVVSQLGVGDGLIQLSEYELLKSQLGKDIAQRMNVSLTLTAIRCPIERWKCV